MGLTLKAQEVLLYDSNGKLITTEPIERKLIPDTYDHLPDGKYYIEYVNTVYIDPNTGKELVGRCPIYKQSKFKRV